VVVGSAGDQLIDISDLAARPRIPELV